MTAANLPKPASMMPGRPLFRRLSTYLTILGALLILRAVYAAMQGREAGRRTHCICNLSILAMACRNYQAAYGVFPPAYIADREGRPMHSWRVLILPYLDREELYAKYNFDEAWDGPNNTKLLDEMPPVFACPSHTPQPRNQAGLLPLSGILACGVAVPAGASRSTCTSYAAVIGPRCVFRGAEPVKESEITDDMSQTLFIGEVTDDNIFWTKPEDIDIAQHPELGDRRGFSSEHPGLVNFALASGGTRSLSIKTPQSVVDALYTRNGNEKLRDGDF